MPQSSSTLSRRRVAVTGLGAVTPVGRTAAETWTNLVAGRSGIGPITQFDATLCPVKIAGEVRDFDPTAARGPGVRPYGSDGHVVTAPLIPKETRKFGRYAQFGLAAALEAYLDSGLDAVRDGLDPERLGANVGVGLGSMF